VHHQMGVGDAGMDFLDAVDGQDVAGGRTGELVGAMRSADGDGQGINAGYRPQSWRLLRHWSAVASGPVRLPRHGRLLRPA
jgi:hypothetical protein